jgi:hypothetical protein
MWSNAYFLPPQGMYFPVCMLFIKICAIHYLCKIHFVQSLKCSNIQSVSRIHICVYTYIQERSMKKKELLKRLASELTENGLNSKRFNNMINSLHVNHECFLDNDFKTLVSLSINKFLWWCLHMESRRQTSLLYFFFLSLTRSQADVFNFFSCSLWRILKLFYTHFIYVYMNVSNSLIIILFLFRNRKEVITFCILFYFLSHLAHQMNEEERWELYSVW